MRVAGPLLAAALALGAACASDTTTTAAEAPPPSTTTTAAPPATFAPVVAPPATFAPVTEVTVAPDEAPAPTDAPEPAPAAPASGLEGLVAQLRVEPERSGAGYDRGLFDHWVDHDRDGCHTRCEVLARQRRTDLPGLPGGGWLSIYDGYSTDDPSELDIDHVVALAEAWRSGADAWDADRRRAFANDLEPGALLAVTAASNRSKGDRDPASWQPPARASWCEYVWAWTTTKLRWDLAADDAEVRALHNMATGCP